MDVRYQSACAVNDGEVNMAVDMAATLVEAKKIFTGVMDK